MRHGHIPMVTRQRLTCLAIAIFVWPAPAAAHPGVGIVQDSAGNVYYTDLKQVWKIGPDGQKSVAVPNVHTHELCLDAEDNLYGEHLWYEGDATKKWGHRVWRLAKGGAVSDVIPAREGFLNDYSFVRDRAGHMYWTDINDKRVIRKRSPDGKIVTYARADFRDPGWMTATAEGTLFLIDDGDLRRVTSDGKVTTVAARLSSHDPPPASVSERHYQMGLWLDDKGNVYVAVARERLVLKVQPDGATSVAAQSPDGWSPSGGMFARDGALWLLEYDASNAVRARRVEREAPVTEKE
jgi:streptogramin lyase